MARTFIDDINDTDYSNFGEDYSFKSGKRPKPFNIGERITKAFKGALKRSPKDILELFRTRIIQLRDLRTKLTIIRGVDVVNSTNRQIDSVQKSIFDLENQFVAIYSDKQGAKAVINSVTNNPDLAISDNFVAQNFLNQTTNPNIVTPVPNRGGGALDYEEQLPSQQDLQQGSEVVDNTTVDLPKKDNTILYLGIGIIAVLLLTRK